jgi:regulatory protein
MTPKQALPKLMKYCAYQERTHQEAREKLYELGVYGDDAEAVIVQLIEDNFLNEERFAKAFAGGKFRMMQWGRQKILHALKQKGLSDYCIKKGMAEIDEDDYLQTLRKLLEKKLASLQDKENNPLLLKQKMGMYAISKGYEAELVWREAQELLKN